MKISVVMPCHNCAPWVQESLESIAAQTYPAHEIIVINDNSTDDSVEKIESSGVQVKLLHTSYGNAAAARNEGIREASGDWVAFLDADDIWLPNHLEDMVAMVAGTEQIAYYSQMDKVDAGRTPGPAFYSNRFPEPATGLDFDDYCHLLTTPEMGCFATPGMGISIARLHEIGGFEESQKRRHDFEMFMRAVRGNTWAYNPTQTWRYRIRSSGNISENVAECSYYHLRALARNMSEGYNAEMRALVSKWARIAVGNALHEGTLTADGDLWKLAKPHLPLHRKALYGLAIRMKGVPIVSVLRGFKRAVSGVRSAR